MMAMLSDHEDSCSPECLMTSVPVKDPYSTDEEKGKISKKVKQKRKCESQYITDSKTEFNDAAKYKTISIESLQKYLNIKYCSKSQGPCLEDMKEMELFELIQNLASFLTNRKDITAVEIVDSVLKAAEPIACLYDNKNYAINMKTDHYKLTDDQLSCMRNCSFADLCCRDFLASLSEILQMPNDSECVTEKYCKVKDCVLKFVILLQEVFDACGSAIDVIATKSTSVETPSEVQSQSFISQPDIMVGCLYNPVSPRIPIHVYCPAPVNEESGQEEKDLTDENIRQFLAENIPENITGHEFTSSFTRFKHQIATEHVIQIISAATNHAYGKGLFNCEPNKAFIGLFVHNEYVYLTKIISDEDKLLQYLAPDIHLQMAKQRNAPTGSSSDNVDKIAVQFSTMVFDLSVHNHRLALLFFIKYYLTHWKDIRIENR